MQKSQRKKEIITFSSRGENTRNVLKYGSEIILSSLKLNICENSDYPMPSDYPIPSPSLFHYVLRAAEEKQKHSLPC